jgi:hypothetical protein
MEDAVIMEWMIERMGSLRTCVIGPNRKRLKF